jgi:hypothetical protein
MGYYHKFVHNYGKIAAPLTTLLKKNAFSWTPTTNHSFQDLKEAMCTTLFWLSLTSTRPLYWNVMPQGKALGLSSCKMVDLWISPTNNFLECHLGQSTYEKEMLAILHVVDLWHPYLLGKCFQIKIDHQSLKYFLEQ